jgi:hypothetical protein
MRIGQDEQQREFLHMEQFTCLGLPIFWFFFSFLLSFNRILVYMLDENDELVHKYYLVMSRGLEHHTEFHSGRKIEKN